MIQDTKQVLNTTVDFKSKSVNRNGTPYLTVKTHKLKDGSTYTFAERAGKDSIQFALVDFRNGLIGGLKSVKPISQEELGEGVEMVATFSGSLDKKDKSLEDIVLEEVKEEAGYTVSKDNLIFIGKFLLSSSSNEVTNLYIVDISDLDGDGRELEDQEVDHSTVWINNEEFLNKCFCANLQLCYYIAKSKYSFMFQPSI